MATSYLRLAAEQTPNAEGGAAKVSKVSFDVPVMTLKLDPNPTPIVVSDEMRGYAGQAPDKGVAEYAPSATFKTRVYPGILGALLLGATGTDTPTAGDGVIHDPDGVDIPTGCTRHVFAWAAGVTPQTFQLNAAPPVGLFYKGSGLGIDSIEFSIDAGCWVADVATKQLYTALIADPAITPAFETPMPFLAGMMTLSTWLAATAITKDFTFKVENTLLCERQFSVASLFPDSTKIDTPWQMLNGHIGKVAMDADDWNAFIAGTTFAAKIKLKHTQTIKRAPVNIVSNSAANPTIVTTAAHSLPAGTTTVVIAGHTGSTPDINGTHVATYINATTFSIPVNCSVGGGASGTMISDTGYYYTLWIEMPACQYASGDIGEITNDRRHEASFEWKATDDATGVWATITLVNATALLTDY